MSHQRIHAERFHGKVVDVIPRNPSGYDKPDNLNAIAVYVDTPLPGSPGDECEDWGGDVEDDAGPGTARSSPKNHQHRDRNSRDDRPTGHTRNPIDLPVCSHEAECRQRATCRQRSQPSEPAACTRIEASEGLGRGWVWLLFLVGGLAERRSAAVFCSGGGAIAAERVGADGGDGGASGLGGGYAFPGDRSASVGSRAARGCGGGGGVAAPL